MVWDSSKRREELPKDWPVRRKRILTRDNHQCTWEEYLGGKYIRCPNPANQVDHRIPGNDHSDQNLRSLCEDHHRAKSASEGGQAMWKKRQNIHERFRRSEKHPSDLD